MAEPVLPQQDGGRPVWEAPHAAVAGMAVTRPNADVDIVLHVETGSVTAAEVTQTLGGLDYELQTSIDDDAPAHRFVRGSEQIDAMIADHGIAKPPQRLGRREMFRIPAGIITLHTALTDPLHPSWLMLEEADRAVGRDTLRILASNPQDFELPTGLTGGPGPTASRL